jgi:hypothetical protein
MGGHRRSGLPQNSNLVNGISGCSPEQFGIMRVWTFENGILDALEPK